MMLWQEVVQSKHMDTSGEPMFHIFCKFFLFQYFFLLMFVSKLPLQKESFNRTWKASVGLCYYDIIGSTALLYLSRRLISSIQMLLAKSESARIYVGVSSKSLADFYANWKGKK